MRATGALECSFTVPVISPATAPGRLIASLVIGNVDGSGRTVFIGDAGTQASDNGGRFWAITGVGNTAGGCHEKWMYDSWPNTGKSGTHTGVWDDPAFVQNPSGTWEVVFGTSNPDQSVYALNAADGSLLCAFTPPAKARTRTSAPGPRSGSPESTASPKGSSTSTARTGSNTRSTW